jgi:hypothetical protein
VLRLYKFQICIFTPPLGDFQQVNRTRRILTNHYQIIQSPLVSSERRTSGWPLGSGEIETWGRGSDRQDKVSQGQGGIHWYHHLVPTSSAAPVNTTWQIHGPLFFSGQAPSSAKSGTILVPSTPYEKHRKTWRTSYMVRGNRGYRWNIHSIGASRKLVDNTMLPTPRCPRSRLDTLGCTKHYTHVSNMTYSYPKERWQVQLEVPNRP